MSDSIDEWDGGAIDGRDQYLGDAPYWNGDGETVDVTDSDEGQVTTENVPGPSEEPAADSTDESETEGAEVPVWPPNPETLSEIRQRLLNGSSTYEVADWVGMSDSAIRTAALGETFTHIRADIPPLTTEGDRFEAEWVVDRDAPEERETETEPQPETETTETGGGSGTVDNDDSEEEPEPEPDQQGSGLVSGDERPVARDPPEPETPTVPTRWIVAGVAFVAGWVLSRLVRGGDDG
jgi:hypothetical protein